MNRGRLRRYALRVLAAASLGVAFIVTAGVAHADTQSGTGSSVGRVVKPPAESAPADILWQ